jgi:hypothetical protein
MRQLWQNKKVESKKISKKVVFGSSLGMVTAH